MGRGVRSVASVQPAVDASGVSKEAPAFDMPEMTVDLR